MFIYKLLKIFKWKFDTGGLHYNIISTEFCVVYISAVRQCRDNVSCQRCVMRLLNYRKQCEMDSATQHQMIFCEYCNGHSASMKAWGISWPADNHLLKTELWKLRACYNAQVNEPKFYLPFLAEGGSGNESARPKGSAGAEASVYLPAGSDCSYSGLNQAHTKSAVRTSVNRGKVHKFIFPFSFGLSSCWIKWHFKIRLSYQQPNWFCRISVRLILTPWHFC